MKNLIKAKMVLVLSLRVISVFTFSCANDQTFEGKWEKDEVEVEFVKDGNKLKAVGTEIGTWDAIYKTNNLILNIGTTPVTCNFKFKKNFKELNLKHCVPESIDFGLGVTVSFEGTWKKK